MPISFNQPDPVSPQISEAYGATQQLSHDLPAIASIYQRNAALQAQQAGQAQALQAQQIGQQAQIGERRLEMQQHGQDQAAQFAASRMPSQRDVFQAAAEQAAQAQRAQNAAWLSQQQLSQQEQADLRKMQESIGYVQQQVRMGQLDEETGNATITKLRTGVDQYKLRQERALALVSEQKQKEMMQQAAFLASVTNEDAAVRARAFDSRTFKRGDDEYYIDHKGDAVLLKKNPTPKEDADKAALLQQQAQEKAKLRLQEMSVKAEAQWDEKLQKAMDRADARAKERNKEQAGLGDQKWAEDFEYYKKAAGLDVGKEAFRQKWLRDHAMGDVQAAGGSGGGQGGVAATPPADPVARQFIAENKPFKVENWEKAATADQKTAVAGWNAIGKNVELYTQDPAQLRAYRDSAAWAARAFATYGSIPAMPPKIREQYAAIQKAMLPFLTPPRRPSAPPPGFVGRAAERVGGGVDLSGGDF